MFSIYITMCQLFKFCVFWHDYKVEQYLLAKIKISNQYIFRDQSKRITVDILHWEYWYSILDVSSAEILNTAATLC